MSKYLFVFALLFALVYFYSENFAAATPVKTVKPAQGRQCSGTPPVGNEWIMSGSNCYLCKNQSATTCAAGYYLNDGLHAKDKRCCTSQIPAGPAGKK